MEINYWIEHFIKASFFAKSIYVVLFTLSVVAWAVMLRKFFLFRVYAKVNAEFLRLYRKNRRDPLSLYRHLQTSPPAVASPLGAIFARGCDEMEAILKESQPARSSSEAPSLSILQLESLEEILRAEMDEIHRRLESGQNFLATTSSVSPLLGLLGTVWGILEAFRSIGVQGAATAATMAPGLAEALITTVVGLMVAIPANLGYNFLGQRAKNLTLAGDTFITEFITNVERFSGLK